MTQRNPVDQSVIRAVSITGCCGCGDFARVSVLGSGDGARFETPFACTFACTGGANWDKVASMDARSGGTVELAISDRIKCRIIYLR